MDENAARHARKVWLTVAIVTTMVIALAAVSHLLTGLLIVFAGALFGIFLRHVSHYLGRTVGLGDQLALGIVALAIVVGGLGVMAFMGTRIANQVTEFSQQFESAASRLQTELQRQPWWQWFESRQSSNGQMPSPGGVLSTASSALLTATSALGGFVLVLFLGFYFALQAPMYQRGITRLLPVDARPRTQEVLRQISASLWWWILGRMIAMVLIGGGSALGLWLLGVPLPITLGVVAGVMNFVPNIGPLIAAIPAVLFALQQGSDTATYVAGFYVVLQFIESYFITPLIDQQQVSLPPGLILSSQLLLGMAAGFLGLLLATPLTATVYVLIRELYVKDTLEAKGTAWPNLPSAEARCDGRERAAENDANNSRPT